MASEGDAGTDAGAMDSAMDDAGASDGPTTYLAEVWADNWSAMYVGDVLVMEDSVPITTERSFNAEVFTFDATPPFQLNVVLKDYIENDSGLEYIGERNQQMGDGGYIAQLTDMSSGEVALVSNADWRCLTIHEAPLNTDCEGDANPLETCLSEISDEPEGWYAADFDDSAWVAASVYSEAEVSPRLGYDEITWNTDAELIWGADLQTHNTVLCRVTVR
ncbi:MAG: PEBP family protein [Myxococcota bacterium]